jgi:hypothetical protein
MPAILPTIEKQFEDKNFTKIELVKIAVILIKNSIT